MVGCYLGVVSLVPKSDCNPVVLVYLKEVKMSSVLGEVEVIGIHFVGSRKSGKISQVTTTEIRILVNLMGFAMAVFPLSNVSMTLNCVPPSRFSA